MDISETSTNLILRVLLTCLKDFCLLEKKSDYILKWTDALELHYLHFDLAIYSETC